jgi:DNA processing protein
MGPVSFRNLLARYGSFDRILSASREELLQEAGLRRDVAGSLLASRGSLPDSAEILSQFESSGLVVLYHDLQLAPKRLLESASPWHCLMALGPISLLAGKPVIGMVGRRRASEEGLQIAHDLAMELARRGVTTLSGMAQGIDRASHLGSLSGGGATIAVLPEGILRFIAENRQASLLDEAHDDGRLLLLSGAPPFQRWSVSEAMRRNAWIAAWCDALIVVEAGEKGGTWKTASDAAQFRKPLWVVTGFEEHEAGVGNLPLALMLRGHRLDAQAPVADLVDVVLEGIMLTAAVPHSDSEAE